MKENRECLTALPIFMHPSLESTSARKKSNLFGFSLAYSYLSPLEKVGCTSVIQRKINFPLVFRLIYTNFAAQ